MPPGLPFDDPDEAAAVDALAEPLSISGLSDAAWNTFLSEAAAQRGADQDRLIGVARSYVEDLAQEIDVAAAVVLGAVARGDFGTSSDVDVIVVSDDLPARAPERQKMLGAAAPRGLQVVGFRRAELRYAVRRGNPNVCGLSDLGIVLRGGELLDALLSDPSPAAKPATPG
jgi:Nucleotidyltransferase domain